MEENKDITVLGETTFRDQRVRFGIKTDDRRRHIYLIGKTGTGKSSMMEAMIISDINAGKGVGLIDPHGDFAEKLLHFIPENRIDDVVYLNPFDVGFPVGFNPLEKPENEEYRFLVASGLMAVFKKVWPDVWSARMEYILHNALLSLLEYPGSTLVDVLRILSDKEFRKEVVDKLTDPAVKRFWTDEFAKYTEKLAIEATASIQNKIGQFVSNPLIRNIVGQPVSTFNLRKIMDEKKIFIVNLSKGRIGEDNSALLGAMLITKMQLAAMARVDVPEKDRQDFNLYIDEFQNFSTDSFANILSEARKYRLDLVLAHQYIEQLSDKVRAAVFGNVGTMCVFRVGAGDAEFLEKEYAPEFTANDLVNLAKYNIYMKLMINGVASRPFSAHTLAPDPLPEKSFVDVIIANNRSHYGVPRAIVEERMVKGWNQKRGIASERAERRNEQSLSTLRQTPPPAPKPKKDNKQHVKKEIDVSALRGLLEKSGPAEPPKPEAPTQ